jgi:glycosyltransferase involved in cell wall biosynthesis
MKAALVTTNLRGGGAEKVVLRVCRLLAARGHEVHLVLLEHLVDHAPEPDVRVHALTAPGRRCGKGFVGKRLAALRLQRLIRALAREREFDLIVSTLPFADEIAALARLPRLWHRIANTLSAEVARLYVASPIKARRRSARYRRLYGAANLIAVSDGVAADLRDKLGYVRANIVRIYNPFDFGAIRREAALPAAGRPDGVYVIHVGRFSPQKRHDLLLDAWRRVDGPEKLVLLTRPDPALSALIRARGLAERVIVAGFQPNPYPWIKGARLLVLCSDHEGMPNVLIEALACGTPVVSTDCPSGPREILVGALSRFLVPCGDAERLSAAIAAALRERVSLADANLERFDARAIVGEFEALPARWRASGEA